MLVTDLDDVAAVVGESAGSDDERTFRAPTAKLCDR